MKVLSDGYGRLEPKDLEIFQFVHEQYLCAFQHFKMLCGARSKKESQICNWRILELVGRGYLEEKYWKEQGIYYFTLGWKGLKKLQRQLSRPRTS